MVRAPCCDTSVLKKGPWTSEEDQKLIDYIQKNGYGNWRTLPKNAGLRRCGKSCRLRWTNYLRPDIKRGRFSFEEEDTIIQLHNVLGNKWSAIAARLPGRTDNEIKNYWNTHIRKRLLRMGIDPVTHSPRLDLLELYSFLVTSNMNYNNHFETSNDVGVYYAQAQFDPVDPNRLIPLHYFNQNHLQLDHYHHQRQQLIQLQAFQQQMTSDYATLAKSHNQSTELYSYGSDSCQWQSIIDLVNGAEQSSSAILSNQIPMLNSVISTPSSSPKHLDNSNSNIYVNNSSCTSTEDEKENNTDNNGSAGYYNSSSLMSLMKFEIPVGIDIDEFIY